MRGLGREARVVLFFLHPVANSGCQTGGFVSWDSTVGANPMDFKLAMKGFDEYRYLM